MSNYGTDDMEAPRLKKQRQLFVTTGGRTRVVGWVGETNRGTFGYVTERDSHKHRIRALDAYAISGKVLTKLRNAGVNTILVAETDSGDVLEYPRAMFHGKHSSDVPDRFLQHGDDRQRFVGVKHAKRWTDHAERVYLPVGEEVQ